MQGSKQALGSQNARKREDKEKETKIMCSKVEILKVACKRAARNQREERQRKKRKRNERGEREETERR